MLPPPNTPASEQTTPLAEGQIVPSSTQIDLPAQVQSLQNGQPSNQTQGETIQHPPMPGISAAIAAAVNSGMPPERATGMTANLGATLPTSPSQNALEGSAPVKTHLEGQPTPKISTSDSTNASVGTHVVEDDPAPANTAAWINDLPSDPSTYNTPHLPRTPSCPPPVAAEPNPVLKPFTSVGKAIGKKFKAGFGKLKTAQFDKFESKNNNSGITCHPNCILKTRFN